MSITVRQLARQIIKIESGGNRSNDSHLNEDYIMLHVRQALNKLIPMVLYENWKNDNFAAPMYIASYEVPVMGEDDRKYLTLPDFYINVPFNKGLKGIAPVEDPTDEFIPRHYPEVSRNRPYADAEGQHTYHTEGYTVRFDKALDLDKVLVKLIVGAPDNLHFDSPLPIYAEQQDTLLRIVRETIMAQPVQDKILDNNKDIGTR